MSVSHDTVVIINTTIAFVNQDNQNEVHYDIVGNVIPLTLVLMLHETDNITSGKTAFIRSR